MNTFLFFGILIGFASCKTIDIRTAYALENQSTADARKGEELLKETYYAMGYDKLEEVTTYEVRSLFKWKMPWSMMPLNALPGNKGNEIVFRFTANSFDGQVYFAEGRKEGKTYGIQSWQGYQFKTGKAPKMKDNARYNWGLPTYHYIIEAPMRLLTADIIRYAGEREVNGNNYDLVYATWGKDEPHKEHDQWLVYINQKTKMIDLTEVTINDFFLPVPNSMKGATIQVERSKAANGSYLPSLVTIQLGKPKKLKKHVYTFELNDYKFDSFPVETLYPFQELGRVGDTKPFEETLPKE